MKRSKTNRIARLFEAAIKHSKKICVGLFLVANVLFLCLPFLSKAIFFDEKALLAGNASPQIRLDRMKRKGIRIRS